MAAEGFAQGELFLSQSAPVEIRESARVRRLNVRVYPGGQVRVSVPKGTSPATVQSFLTRHRDWIERKVAQFSVVEEASLPVSIDVPSTGDTFVVHYRPGRAGFRLPADRVLEVRHAPDQPEEARRVLATWAMAEAQRSLEPWLAALSAETGLTYRAVQWRRQRTRWGSCSRSGTLSLNVAVLFQPPEVVRYLFIHELSHTRHMNHSAKFWSLVESHEPDWRTLDRQLTDGWRLVPSWVNTRLTP
jgi:predicted metal-dependent hydrolase